MPADMLLDGFSAGIWQAVSGGVVTGAGFALWGLRQKISKMDKRQAKIEERQLLLTKATIVLTQLIDAQVKVAHPDMSPDSEKIISDLLKPE